MLFTYQPGGLSLSLLRSLVESMPPTRSTCLNFGSCAKLEKMVGQDWTMGLGSQPPDALLQKVQALHLEALSAQCKMIQIQSLRERSGSALLDGVATLLTCCEPQGAMNNF